MTTIMLVEDTVDLATVIMRELQGAGHTVLHTTDGFSALTLYDQQRPDLVILDWMLPGLDGLEVLRRLRRAGPTPVLMLTARDEETDRVLGLELGADDYLTKPFSMRELLARVRALLRRVEMIQQMVQADKSADDAALPPLRQGALYIDPQAYIVTVEGQALDLTRTEFLLLHLLARNPGRAFSRDYLLDTVWGQSYVEGDRAVDNTILRLRKKLGTLGEAIETVWGVGYRWHYEA